MADTRLLEKEGTFLDSTALRALNVFAAPGDKSKHTSLYGLLNINQTAMGSSLLRTWMNEPLQDISEIHERHDIVEDLVKNREMCLDIREEHLKKIPDISSICARFAKKKATLENMVRLYECSVRLPLIVKLFDGASDLCVRKFAKPLAEYSKELVNFEKLVETTIDLDEMRKGEYIINPSVNPDLGALREKLDAIETKIDKEHRKIDSQLNISNKDGLKLENHDKYGHIFRVSRKNESAINGSTKYIVIATSKDGVRFQTRVLRDLARDFDDIMKTYNVSSKGMLQKTLAVGSGYVEVFEDVCAVIGELDVLASFAQTVSQAHNSYCRPTMLPGGQGLVLKGARHPIVEENMVSVDNYIANDFDLRKEPGGNHTGGGALLIVTGPNMGGKSTFIRTAGVATILAHIGAFIPAEEANIPLTDRILCRVGAWDNHHRQESTFMAEMLETSAILKVATKNSLIIIDELGRGTGTTDGYGLADAICSHIVTEIGASCLFATHFYELTELSAKYNAVRNLHVTANVDTDTKTGKNNLTFLYEALPGVCDRSFGVNVAEMAHFPAAVVDMARIKTEELEKEGNTNANMDTDVDIDMAAVGDTATTGISTADAIAQLRKLAVCENRSEAIVKTRELRQKLLAMNSVQPET